MQKAVVVLCVNLLGMLHIDWKNLLFLLLFVACKNAKSDESQLIVTVGQTVLRAKPFEKSPELAVLEKGQSVTDLGEVSANESQLDLHGKSYQTPWIKVRSADGNIGWVQAMALKPKENPSKWMLQKKLECYFGKAIADRRAMLMESQDQVATESQLAQAWQESRGLRDTFGILLSRRPETGFQTQYAWLGAALPGFLYQKVGDSGSPYLFADFKFWYEKALKTKGEQDDAYFQTCLAAFPFDSIESFFPVWKFQVSDTKSASQLGAGYHQSMLNQIDKAIESNGLFASDLQDLKEQLLEDVFDKDIEYWQDKEKILNELSQILAQPPKCLDVHTLESLAIRKKMFESPLENGITVNLRSGN